MSRRFCESPSPWSNQTCDQPPGHKGPHWAEASGENRWQREDDDAPRITRAEVAFWTLAAVVLVAVLVLALTGVGVDPGSVPTDAPSGERPMPCAEDDRACNEWIDVQEEE